MRSIIRGLTIAGALGLATLSLGAQGGTRGSTRGGTRGVTPVQPDSIGARARPRIALRARPRIALRARAMQQRAAARGIQVTPRQIRNRMIARRAAVRQRVRGMTPAQRGALTAGREALRTERQGIVAQVRAGTLTRAQARQQMMAWRQTHRPNAALRLSRPPGDGDEK